MVPHRDERYPARDSISLTPRFVPKHRLGRQVRPDLRLTQPVARWSPTETSAIQHEILFR
ncbi:hypothetical protein RB2019 [Rhodopirellula baltica SH 1]|uniref:Uncharacterized protein n=1 Tax=Rhodopirellula baltica (strain DSM 10527 / NCIMB 13988 / SH1) TaxID=243090 RepID=Q7UWI1_RHOBA|nr:hypothetical protein RB2019 [Rhodopirellula baltica SH 1]